MEAVEVKNTNYMGYTRVREKEEEEEEEEEVEQGKEGKKGKKGKEKEKNTRKEGRRNERKKLLPHPRKWEEEKPRCELEFPKWEGKTKSSQRGERGKEQKVKL